MDNYNKDQGRYSIENLDKPLEILGLSLKNVNEFSTKNIKLFNEVAENNTNIDYFSIGA